MCFGLKLQAKGGLNNLDFSICFQMLKIYDFEISFNICEMWSNGIKIAIFSKKLQKTAQRLGASSPDHVCDTFELQYTSLIKHVSQFRHFRTLGICLSPLLERVPKPTPGHDFWSSILQYLCPHKNSSFEVSDDVSACDLWFATLQSKILATPMLRYLAF